MQIVNKPNEMEIDNSFLVNLILAIATLFTSVKWIAAERTKRKQMELQNTLETKKLDIDTTDADEIINKLKTELKEIRAELNEAKKEIHDFKLKLVTANASINLIMPVLKGKFEGDEALLQALEVLEKSVQEINGNG